MLAGSVGGDLEKTVSDSDMGRSGIRILLHARSSATETDIRHKQTIQTDTYTSAKYLVS